MHRIGVSGRMHRDGRNAQLAASPLDTQGDLAAIGDKDFLKQGEPYSTIIKSSPNSTGELFCTTIFVTVPAFAALI